MKQKIFKVKYPIFDQYAHTSSLEMDEVSDKIKYFKGYKVL